MSLLAKCLSTASRPDVLASAWKNTSSASSSARDDFRNSCTSSVLFMAKILLSAHQQVRQEGGDARHVGDDRQHHQVDRDERPYAARDVDHALVQRRGGDEDVQPE